MKIPRRELGDIGRRGRLDMEVDSSWGGSEAAGEVVEELGEGDCETGRK